MSIKDCQDVCSRIVFAFIATKDFDTYKEEDMILYEWSKGKAWKKHVVPADGPVTFEDVKSIIASVSSMPMTFRRVLYVEGNERHKFVKKLKTKFQSGQI